MFQMQNFHLNLSRSKLLSGPFTPNTNRLSSGRDENSNFKSTVGVPGWLSWLSDSRFQLRSWSCGREIELHARHGGCLRFSLSLSLCPSLLARSLSLSKKKTKTKTKKTKEHGGGHSTVRLSRGEGARWGMHIISHHSEISTNLFDCRSKLHPMF